ncbi:MAG: DUF4159 domain-containing protein [Tepidisphaeraceae bacterium]
MNGAADELATESALPYVEPLRPVNTKWVKPAIITAAVILCFLGAFALVYYTAEKAKEVFAARSAATTSSTTSTPPPPAPTTSTPAGVETTPAPSAPAAPTNVPSPATTVPTTTVPVVPAIEFAPALHPKRYEDPAGTVTDKAINDAIVRGVTYLIGQVEPAVFNAAADDQREGRFALCVLALLHAGLSTTDERLNMSGDLMPGLIERMKKYPMNEGRATYARAIRSLALAVHDRKVDRQTLTADLDWLIKSSMGGAYYYWAPKTKEERAARAYDNSNSQYGALGVWGAADAGLSVPNSYWEEIEKHWGEQQLPSGAWGYTANGAATLTMTAGGLTSLFVAGDMLAATRNAEGVDRAPFRPAIQRALDWLATGDNALNVSGHEGYALYGLERAGLASGFKRFGKHDWFRVHAHRVLASHAADGSWGGSDGALPETSFRILFLARGRHPISMNKLRFDGAWANRPRDVAKLSDFLYDTIERPVNWQVANLADGWIDWMDSPVLYLASHGPVELSDDNLKQIRLYIENGGLLLTNADAGSITFTKFVDALAKQLFPEYEMRDLSPEHDVYSMVYKMTGKRPPLRGLSSATRMLMIHSTEDLSSTWQNRLPKIRPIPFQMGANVFVYATGKGVLRNRLDTPAVPETPGEPLGTFAIARVKHSGAWNPEPAAWGRMARWFRRETNVALSVVDTDVAKLNRNATPFAHLTSSATWKPSEAELQSIRAYVRGGGMLFLDPCGGSQELALALQRDVAQAAFPDVLPRDVTEKDRFVTGTGEGMDDISRPLARVYAVEVLENKIPPMQVIGVGKGWIISSRLDVVSGLLGTSTWGIIGYDHTYAQSLMKNLILFACNGRMIVGPATLPTEETAPSSAG